VTWIDHGVLVNLPNSRRESLDQLQSDVAFPSSGAFRMSGGTTTITEMIATTKRGILVTRFFGLLELDRRSMLRTGLTRDGLWLIENGTISRAIKNFRFTESPLFVFNNVETLGVPVPVFSPGTPAIVPPVKARDFSFTSLVDAV
jgi:predicted Zn-dependent protease